MHSLNCIYTQTEQLIMRFKPDSFNDNGIKGRRRMKSNVSDLMNSIHVCPKLRSPEHIYSSSHLLN
jgi:hypothetical protein